METRRRSEADRTVVPNRYAIRLNPADMAHFAPVADSLAAELADSALTFARSHHYILADRPRVSLHANRGVAVGEIVVDGTFEEALASADAAVASAARAPNPSHGADTSSRPPVDVGTAVFRAPQPVGPIAILREHRADGHGRSVVLDGRPMTLGRAKDNDLVLSDSGVSRHHARLQGRGGALILTDLQSSNGSRVNGVAVTEVVLGPGDRIQLGETVLIVHAPAEA